MGVIATILFGFAAVVAQRLIADEVKAWLPKITGRLIARAVKRLPEEDRERFAEEWRGHIDDTPGDLSKIIAAFGFLRASTRICRSKGPAEARHYVLECETGSYELTGRDVEVVLPQIPHSSWMANIDDASMTAIRAGQMRGRRAALLGGTGVFWVAGQPVTSQLTDGANKTTESS